MRGRYGDYYVRVGDGLETFFPFVKVFAVPYLIRFPQEIDGAPLFTATTKHFTLRFAGPLGTLDLRWNTVVGQPPTTPQ